MTNREVAWILFATLTAITIGGCHDFPRETNASPANACPKPEIKTTHWPVKTVNDCGVRLRLPKGYAGDEGGPMGNDSVEHIYRRNSFDTITVAFELQPDSTLAERKTIRQSHYEGYSECTETIGGYDAFIQSYRGGGTVTDGHHELTQYSAEALWQLKVGEFVRIQGATTDRHSQEEILAAIRTVEFVNRSPTKPLKESTGFAAFFQLAGVFAIPLAGYFVVAVGGGWMLFRRKARELSISERRRRILLAAYLAVVLTPSVLTDLFLFAIPAPALIGFFALIPSLFYIEHWRGSAYAIGVLYIIPILFVFAVFYAGLTVYARLRNRRLDTQ